MVRLPGRGAREEQPQDNVVDLLQHRLKRSKESMRSAAPSAESPAAAEEKAEEKPAATPAEPTAIKRPDPWARALENLRQNAKRPAA